MVGVTATRANASVNTAALAVKPHHSMGLGRGFGAGGYVLGVRGLWPIVASNSSEWGIELIGAGHRAVTRLGDRGLIGRYARGCALAPMVTLLAGI